MTDRAKTNLIFALLFAGAVLLGVLDVPTWQVVLILVAGFVVFAAVMMIRVARAVGPPDSEVHRTANELIRKGEMTAAIALLSRRADTAHLTENPAAPPQPTLTAVLATDLALAYALDGDVPAATSWLRTADEQANDTSAAHRVSTALVRAVIDCRSTRYDDAARALDELWPELEHRLTAQQLRPLWIVRAFAQSQGGARDGGAAEAALTLVRPSFGGEHAYLGKAWPEMERYLVQNGLS